MVQMRKRRASFLSGTLRPRTVVVERISRVPVTLSPNRVADNARLDVLLLLRMSVLFFEIVFAVLVANAVRALPPPFRLRFHLSFFYTSFAARRGIGIVIVLFAAPGFERDDAVDVSEKWLAGKLRQWTAQNTTRMKRTC
jgi:hypothetical protein